MRSLKKGVIVVLLLAGLMLGGCGSSDDPGGRKVDLLIADCSASFRASSLR